MGSHMPKIYFMTKYPLFDDAPGPVNIRHINPHWFISHNINQMKTNADFNTSFFVLFIKTNLKMKKRLQLSEVQTHPDAWDACGYN